MAKVYPKIGMHHLRILYKIRLRQAPALTPPSWLAETK